jgi:hypothetical protein
VLSSFFTLLFAVWTVYQITPQPACWRGSALSARNEPEKGWILLRFRPLHVYSFRPPSSVLYFRVWVIVSPFVSFLHSFRCNYRDVTFINYEVHTHFVSGQFSLPVPCKHVAGDFEPCFRFMYTFVTVDVLQVRGLRFSRRWGLWCSGFCLCL